MSADKNLIQWEVDFKEINISQIEYEKRVVRLVKLLIQIDPVTLEVDHVPQATDLKEAA